MSRNSTRTRIYAGVSPTNLLWQHELQNISGTCLELWTSFNRLRSSSFACLFVLNQSLLSVVVKLNHTSVSRSQICLTSVWQAQSSSLVLQLDGFQKFAHKMKKSAKQNKPLKCWSQRATATEHISTQGALRRGLKTFLRLFCVSCLFSFQVN